MKSYLSEKAQDNRQSLLKTPQQISLEAYLGEFRLGIALMTIGVLAIWLFHQIAENIETELPVLQVTLLIPSHLLATFLVFFKPSVRNLSISFSAIMASLISMCVVHLWLGFNTGFSQGLLLFSLPYLTFACCTITIMPRVIAFFLPIYMITLVALFFKTADQFDAVLNTTIFLAFIFSVASICFIGIIFNTNDRRIVRLAEKQRAQLEDISFTKDLLNFALIETKQTIIFNDEYGVRQHPELNEFTEFSQSLPQDAVLPTDLLGLLTQHGYQAARVQDITTEHAPNLRVLNHSSGRSYFAKSSVTPSGIETVLLSDVTKLIRAGGLLNAALNGNKIGVSCYDETGQLLMSRGATPNTIPAETHKSLALLKQMIFNTDTNQSHASNFSIGDKFYDISFMRYGELNLVTHVDVTARNQVELELRTSQKMSIIGELSSGIAHDYNNVLSIILSNIELIAMNDKDNKFKGEIDTLVNCIDHASAISQKLLLIARKQEPEFTTINVSETISAMSPLMTSAIGSKIKFQLKMESDLHIRVVLQEFQTAILNIVMNSRFAIANKAGNIVISAYHDKDAIKICVTDDGPGIPRQDREKVFDLFFTTHTREYSTGLGLAMVKSFMASSGGTVKAPSTKKGAKIELTFPLTTMDSGKGARKTSTKIALS